MEETDFNITTELNGEVTQLTEEETLLLFELRMMSEEEREKVREIIEQLKSQ